MRKPREVIFRFRQEASNVWLWAHPPSVSFVERSPLAGLPDPSRAIERLRGTPFAAEVERLAELVLEHRLPLLGAEIDAGENIEWRRDYVNKVTSGLSYSRLVPYLDFSSVGDHKLIWELNRHQHFVLLAQAFRFTGREELVREIRLQLTSWLETNPYMRGINWASALEVALRALSWTWVYHLAGEHMDEHFQRRLLTALYRHGSYLEHNLSVYFSPNTHLLGEAVALHALGVLFPSFPKADRWNRVGAELVDKQMDLQVHEDGSHFERSTYYHLYALDMFLFHQVLAQTSGRFTQKLRRMAEYLAAVSGEARLLPMLGDEDGGRFFHPYGRRDGFGRATLATCAVLLGNPEWACREEDLHEQAVWWLGASCLDSLRSGKPAPCGSRLFPNAGVAVMNDSDLHVVADAGPFGAGSAGHSHSDTLSFVVTFGSEEILIDPGTCTYVGDPKLRDWFRGTVAHNTVRIDQLDQALPAGPFGWADKPESRILEWHTTPTQDFLDADCRYSGFLHRRRLLFVKPDLLFVFDEVEGPSGDRVLEQFWHCSAPVVCCAPGCYRIGCRSRIVLPAAEVVELFEGGEHGWRSPVFGTRERAPVLRVRRESGLPAQFFAILDFSGSRETSLQLKDSRTCAFQKDGQGITVWYASQGMPVVELTGR